MKSGLAGRLLTQLRAWIGGGTQPIRSQGLDPSAVVYSTGRLDFNGRPASDIVVGPQTHIRGELLLFGHGGKITLGGRCYVGEQTRIWSACSIEIGERVLISHLCTIMDNLTHPISPSARAEQFKTIITAGHPVDLDLGERPVRIEDDVLIGCHSIILRGVTIGRGAIVGAGSVVTGDVAPFTIVAGNPARLVRELSLEERR